MQLNVILTLLTACQSCSVGQQSALYGQTYVDNRMLHHVYCGMSHLKAMENPHAFATASTSLGKLSKNIETWLQTFAPI